MPSINRPNAPNRLPSADFADLFHKPHALRASDFKSAVNTPSPLSTPAKLPATRRAFRSPESGKPFESSPLASPAIGTSQRRPQYQERSAYWSESDTRLPDVFGLKDSYNAPSTIREEPTPVEYRESASPSQSNRWARRSSISEQGGTSPQPDDEDALHEARAGHKWARDFLGGRLEIRVGRQRASEGTSSGESPRVEHSEIPPIARTESIIEFPMSHATTSKETAGHGSEEPLCPKTPESFDKVSTLDPLKEGLYCRTKRALGLKHGPVTPYIEPRSRTPTGGVLDRVSSTLRMLPARTLTASTTAASSVSNLSIAAPRRRRQRRSGHNRWSASSSVRDLMMGKPPVGTPEPEKMYTGSDSKQYPSVRLTEPDAPAFLPSEARRINTPPLTGGSTKGHPRGFFFDYDAPDEQDRERSAGQHQSSLTTIKPFEQRRPSDWYRVALDTIDSGEGAPKGDLDYSIPEHLPSSPLCPKHPKNSSRGLGTCPYHGRNKSIPSDNEKTSMLGPAGKLSPVAEDWWMK